MDKMKKYSWQYGAIAIFPLVLFAIGIVYLNSMGRYFLKSVDPEYAYLFNGLLMANLKPDVQFTTNPGTPIQVIFALVSRTVHCFRPGMPLATDVLINPEFYIRSVLWVINFMNTAALFLLGYFTFSFSKNIVLAVFLQLAPFTNILTLEVLARMMPEAIMNVIVCGWIIAMVKLIYENKPGINYKNYSLVFGILFGLGFSDKLTFLPFFLIPLIILPAWKYRLRFAGYSILSFMVFAFPVVLNRKNFYNWVTNMFTHTGAYGGGDRGIIKWNEFMDHLKLQLANTGLLIVSVLLLLLIIIILCFWERKKAILKEVRVRISLALVTAILFEYLMTAKQFAFHYMIPSILLNAFTILMIFLLLNRLRPQAVNSGSLNFILGLLGGLFLLNIGPKSVKQVKEIREIVKTKTNAYLNIRPFLNGTPKIICPSYYGCSAVEYALTYGLHESGRYGNYLFEKISRLYPSIYMYFPWGKVFYEGNKEILADQFVKPGTVYYLYIAEFSEEKLKEIVAAMMKGSHSEDYCVTRLYFEPETAEGVYSFETGIGEKQDHKIH
jgi:hypothetical protein